VRVIKPSWSSIFQAQRCCCEHLVMRGNHKTKKLFYIGLYFCDGWCLYGVCGGTLALPICFASWIWETFQIWFVLGSQLSGYGGIEPYMFPAKMSHTNRASVFYNWMKPYTGLLLFEQRDFKADAESYRTSVLPSVLMSWWMYRSRLVYDNTRKVENVRDLVRYRAAKNCCVISMRIRSKLVIGVVR
jgi:hypothetical protein